MGGQMFITWKEGLVDEAGVVTVEATRDFLRTFMERFAALVGKLTG